MEQSDLMLLLQENRAILEENRKLVSENNKLLRIMKRNATIAFWFRMLWLLVLVGGPILFYMYFLQPILETLPFGSGTGISVQLEQLEQLFNQLPR